MTFSILARDPTTGAIGGAAATGSLCVGGWVLRGDLAAGMSASQGAAPSTFWGEDVLAKMREGFPAAEAVDLITDADRGREYRQLAALDLGGQSGAFTGASNEPEMGSRTFVNGIVSGNMLANASVLDEMVEHFTSVESPFELRLLSTLRAAAQQGGDYRGLLSAAILVLHPERPPLTLRIDHHSSDPIGALEDLYQLATSRQYSSWTAKVPVAADKERALD